MNSFSHALPFLDRPYVAIGSSVPDILAAADRRCRARKKYAEQWIDHADEIVKEVAQGVVYHHEDDAWFHKSAEFNRLNMQFAIEFRDRFENGHSMRPSLIGHIIIEMFLDCFLELKFPGSIETFYQSIAKVDPVKVEAAVNQFASRPTTKIVAAIKFFLKERYVFDYATDAGIRYRMNKVLGRIKLDLMPESTEGWLSGVREIVYQKADQLLEGYRLKW